MPRPPEPARQEIVEQRVENPFGSVPARVQVNGALMSAEQQRAVAEVQAQMIIARSSPRDPVRATDNIIQECTRLGLAEHAEYQYAKGGTDISGPSIRLAETIARHWGNMSSGVKELYRDREEGYSECVAYAWDLETGYRDEKQFQIRHWRDTKQGGYRITDEREIYELIANYGQRRKRACILAVIPGDVVEVAIEQCKKTLVAKADTSPENIKKLIMKFAEFGVNQRHIEQRIQRRIEAIRPAQVIELRRIYNSLKDAMSEPGDWFRSAAAPATEETKPAATKPVAKPVAKPVTKPVETKKAAPVERPKAPEPKRPVIEFESYLCDANGETVDGEIFTDPRLWLAAYRASLRDAFPPDLPGIVENNEAAVDYIIRNYPDLAEEEGLTDEPPAEEPTEEPVEELTEEEEPTEEPTGEPIEEPTETSAEPTEQREVVYQPVEVPARGPSGQRDLQGYLDACSASLHTEVVDPASLGQWLDRNRSTLNSMPATVVKAVEEMIDALGIVLAAQPDIQWPVR